MAMMDRAAWPTVVEQPGGWGSNAGKYRRFGQRRSTAFAMARLEKRIRLMRLIPIRSVRVPQDLNLRSQSEGLP
jgi:hypothetical protein